jgi:hypothetical protein
MSLLIAAGITALTAILTLSLPHTTEHHKEHI